MSSNNFPITHLTVHCAATPPDMDIGAKEIDRMHRMRNFLCIGYHFVIRRNGVLETGRTVDKVGAHVEGHNKGNLGICLVGGVDKKNNPENNFTPEQFTTLRKLLADLLKDYPKAEILGHRDWPDVHKACPCFDVRDWWLSDLSGEQQ